ncbi:hypothetical protein [Methanobrevibacter sp.]
MTVDTLGVQQENDYSKALMIVDKSSHIVQNNVNLVKNDISEEYDAISNLKSVINFNKSLDNLAIILNKIPSFNHEFHCVMSVRRMSDFVLTDDNFTHDFFDFLLVSVNQFITIIEFKLTNLSDMDSSSCKTEYKNISREFLKSEKFFFTKIYKSSRSHDKVFFEDMIRLLVR